MNPLSPLSEKLNSLPFYWKPRIKTLSSACDKEGTVLSLRTLLFALRDMPYERPLGGSNSAYECITRWRGTCSAKHVAAYELLKCLGFSPKLWLACYRMDFTKPYYSDQLRAQAEGLDVYDVHNFITCQFGDRSITIDITFPRFLGIHGLPVTESWTGENDFVLCCVPEEVLEVRLINQADQLKRKWLGDLNSKEGTAVREKAIVELMSVAKHQCTDPCIRHPLGI